MVEPTETESKETIDAFISTMRTIAEEIKTDPERFYEAPRTTKVRRLDETGAARNPCLTGCGL
jgi:glycine dehydrogenase subunit 2